MLYQLMDILSLFQIHTFFSSLTILKHLEVRISIVLIIAGEWPLIKQHYFSVKNGYCFIVTRIEMYCREQVRFILF